MEQNPSSFPAKSSGGTACLIVAGGSGTRCGMDTPKQFCPLGGEPVLAHSVRFFGQHPSVDQLVVVAPPALVVDTKDLVRHLSLAIPCDVVPGGQRRQDSVLAGLRQAATSGRVLVHDGARPFPPLNLDEALDTLANSETFGHPTGVIFAIPATDSIKRVDDHTVRETLPRAELWAVQTPQIFPTAKLIEALDQCDSDGAEVTDDASAFEHMGWPVHVIMGSRTNIKITYAEDFIMAEAILQARRSSTQTKGSSIV
jgi:2-C-methyl-D-erythritol 4-phosphate cytidylyltransferase